MDMRSIILNPKTINEDWWLIVALKEGRVLQYECEPGHWYDYTGGSIDFNGSIRRRIKPPEPKLRAWNSSSEFPTGDVWLRSNKYTPATKCRVVCVSGKAVSYIDASIKHLSWGDAAWLTLDYSTDGGKTFLPCGVTE